MSIRSAASCSQPRQVSSGPRGARTGRGPDIGPSLLLQVRDDLLAELARPERGDRHHESVAEMDVVGLGAARTGPDEDIATGDGRALGAGHATRLLARDTVIGRP